MKSISDADFTYIWFDFHHECRKMQWGNLSKLISKMSKELKDFKYFMASSQYGFDRRDQMNRDTVRIDSE
jgi:hypothetical protein